MSIVPVRSWATVKISEFWSEAPTSLIHKRPALRWRISSPM